MSNYLLDPTRDTTIDVVEYVSVRTTCNRKADSFTKSPGEIVGGHTRTVVRPLPKRASAALVVQTFWALGSSLQPFNLMLPRCWRRNRHFCKAVFVNDLRPAVRQSILPRYQYNIIDQWAVLKTAQRIIKHRFSADLQKLFLYFTVHSFSLYGTFSRSLARQLIYYFQDVPDVADLANEWERLLLTYGDTLKSTPHLYLSALSWLPRSSRLWKIVHNFFSSELPIVSNVQEELTSERWSEDVGAPSRSTPRCMGDVRQHFVDAPSMPQGAPEAESVAFCGAGSDWGEEMGNDARLTCSMPASRSRVRMWTASS